MNISYNDGMAVLMSETSPLEKCTLMALLLHIHPTTGLSFPAQATLAKEVGCSERQIRRILTSLKSKCLIEIHQSGPGSKRHTPSYTMPFSESYRYIEERNAKYSAKQAAKAEVNESAAESTDTVSTPRKSNFTPPTVDEVAEYIDSKGYEIDPEEFCDYYESIGWLSYGRPITAWQARCDIWQRRMDRGQ